MRLRFGPRRRGEKQIRGHQRTVAPSTRGARGRERERRASLSSWGVSRTYNKLKSHHPRDLAAITRPFGPSGVGERPGKCPAVVSRHIRTPMVTTATTEIMMESARALVRETDESRWRKNDGEGRKWGSA